MTTAHPPASTLASAAYAALRHGGAPPSHAGAQLGLAMPIATRLERLFQARRAGGQRPRFARHDDHVRAALATGGFPALPERPR